MGCAADTGKNSGQALKEKGGRSRLTVKGWLNLGNKPMQ